MFTHTPRLTPSTAKKTARWAQEKGASLVEYALLVALIAVVCISAVAFLGTSTSKSTGDAGTAVANGGAEDTPTTQPEMQCAPGWQIQLDQFGNPYCYP